MVKGEFVIVSKTGSNTGNPINDAHLDSDSGDAICYFANRIKNARSRRQPFVGELRNGDDETIVRVEEMNDGPVAAKKELPDNIRPL